MVDVDYVDAIIEASKKPPVFVRGLTTVKKSPKKVSFRTDEAREKANSAKFKVLQKSATRSVSGRHLAQVTVIQLIEHTVTADELQRLCRHINPGQYEDVCSERCLTGVCGYPLCPVTVTDTYGRRTYVIRNNTLYDIARRRNYCSNVCFEASALVQQRVSFLPHYLREGEPQDNLTVQVPCRDTLVGLHGDAVDIGGDKEYDEDIRRLHKSKRRSAKKVRKAASSKDSVACTTSDVAVAGLLHQASGETQDQGTAAPCEGPLDQPQETHNSTATSDSNDCNKKCHQEEEEEAATKQKQHDQDAGGDISDCSKTGSGVCKQKSSKSKRKNKVQSTSESYNTVVENKNNQYSDDVNKKSETNSQKLIVTSCEETSAKIYNANNDNSNNNNINSSNNVTNNDSNNCKTNDNICMKDSERCDSTTKQNTAAHLKQSQAKSNDSKLNESRGADDNNSATVCEENSRAAGLEIVKEVEQHLQQWLSWESYVLLLGEKYLRGLLDSRGVAYDDMIPRPDVPEFKLSSSLSCSRYVSLCQKLTRQEREEELEAARLETGTKKTRPSKPLPEIEDLERNMKDMQIKVKAFYSGTIEYPVATEDDDAITPQVQSMPLVDCLEQKAWRRKVFMEKLHLAERTILSGLCLRFEVVRPLLGQLVASLALSKDNLYLRPQQWMLVLIAMLKLLSIRCPAVHSAMTDQSLLQKELLPRLTAYGLDMDYLDKLLAYFTSDSSILNAFAVTKTEETADLQHENKMKPEGMPKLEHENGIQSVEISTMKHGNEVKLVETHKLKHNKPLENTDCLEDRSNLVDNADSDDVRAQYSVTEDLD